jgi:hypothetical protein
VNRDTSPGYERTLPISIERREFLPRGDRFGDIIILSPRFQFNHCPSTRKFAVILSTVSTAKDQLNDQTILIVRQR